MILIPGIILSKPKKVTKTKYLVLKQWLQSNSKNLHKEVKTIKNEILTCLPNTTKYIFQKNASIPGFIDKVLCEGRREPRKTCHPRHSFL